MGDVNYIETSAGNTLAVFLSVLPPVLVGALAVYFLLPRPRGCRPVLGAAFAAGALLLTGWLLIRNSVLDVESLLFYGFAVMAVTSGGLLVTQRNPVRGALAFAIVVLSTCGLFLLQAAPFLMAATIIIYAGAIIVTFLFVIMLAQQLGVSNADLRSREPQLAVITGFTLLGSILILLFQTYNNLALSELIEQAGRAATHTSIEAIRGELGGDPEEFLRSLQREAVRVKTPSKHSDALIVALDEARQKWISLESSEREGRAASLEAVTSAFKDLHAAGRQVCDAVGQYQPPARLALSRYSYTAGTGDGSEPARDRRGRPAMPAENVAALGRSLFTDYLLPVELGGTLLLVAVIGAIVIAARSSEGRLR